LDEVSSADEHNDNTAMGICLIVALLMLMEMVHARFNLVLHLANFADDTRGRNAYYIIRVINLPLLYANTIGDRPSLSARFMSHPAANSFSTTGMLLCCTAK